MHLLDLLLEIIRILGGEKIMPAGYRIELHGMKIGRPDLVSACGQRLDRGPEHGAVKTLVLGMGEDDENFHGSPVLTFSISVG